MSTPVKFCIACALVVGSSLLVWACDGAPLLAPTGSTIALIVPTVAQAINQDVTIVARVTEASGSAPQSGTRVNFTTSLGTIQSSAETDSDGQATALLNTGGSNGKATISAASGRALATATVDISPPTVLISAARGASTGTSVEYSFEGIVIPSTNVVGYSWNFGDNSAVDSGGPEKRTTAHTYNSPFISRTVQLTIFTQNAQQASGSISFVPTP